MKSAFFIWSFLLIYVFNGTVISAQESKLDSLKSLLEKESNDKKKALILAQISLEYYKDQEKRIAYIKQALKLAEKTDNKIAKSLALYSLSHYYLVKNNLDKADSIAKINIDLALNTLDSFSISNAYKFYGYYYSMTSDYNKSASYYKESLQYIPHNLIVKKYLIQENYAISLANLSDYKKSLGLLLEVLKYWESRNNILRTANLYTVLGSVVLNIGDEKSALNYFYKALDLGKKQKLPFILAQSNYDIGYYYYYKTDLKLDSAKYFLLHALKYAEEIKNNMLIADINTALGAVYLDLNMPDSAIIHYRRVIDLAERVNDRWALVYGYMGLAKVYNSAQNYGKALFYLYKVEPIADKVNASELLIDFYDIFAETQALAGNFREAYHYMKLYNQVSDKFYKEKSATELANLKIQYETEKKEQENKRLLAENKFKEQSIKNQYYINISIAILLLLSIAFAFSFFKGKQNIQKANDLLKEKNSEILNQNEEIKLKTEEVSEAYSKLKELDEYKQGLSNMIIHDLKNPLNIILNMAENKLVKEAANKMFNLVSDILDVAKLEEAKIILNRSDCSLKDISENAIRKTAFTASISGIEIINNIYEDVSVFVDKDLTERIFINLLSNAIKFSPQNSKIFINIEFDGNKIRVSIVDFGMGIPQDQIEHIFDKFVQFKAVNSDTSRSTGLGLTFCKLAVEAQGGEIGVESSVNTGSVFSFTLPLSTTKKAT